MIGRERRRPRNHEQPSFCLFVLLYASLPLSVFNLSPSLYLCQLLLHLKLVEAATQILSPGTDGWRAVVMWPCPTVESVNLARAPLLLCNPLNVFL